MPVGGRIKAHQHKLQRVTPPPVQGVFATMAAVKMPPAQVAASDYHHFASGVLALVDNRITPQAQGAKIRTEGAKVKISISVSR